MRYFATVLMIFTPLIASCAGGGGKVAGIAIRPIGEQQATKGADGGSLGLAATHLALGNIGLAIGDYRRAARDDPNSTIALAGLAECYARMDRFDLAHRYYEEALALAPDDRSLKARLATIYDREGLTQAALALRRETSDFQPGAAPALTAQGSASVLPRPVDPVVQQASVTIDLPPPTEGVVRSGPRLERVSLGEVALVTSDRPQWIARRIAAGPRSVTIRFDPRPEPLIVLNAARVAGIAARTRDYLASRGFAKGRIGNAPSVQQVTQIRYPANARPRALALAGQLRFAAQLAPHKGPLTLLVGRDAAVKGVGKA